MAPFSARASFHSLVLALGPLLLVAACADSPIHTGFRADTLPSGRIEVFNGPEGSWAPGEEWRVEERFHLGSEEPDSPELFSFIPDLELDALGRLWLIEQMDQEIRVFEEDGSHVRSIGRAGEGPGEFANVVALLWDPNGNLWAVDQRQGRVSVFDTAGTFLSSKRLESLFQMMPWPGGIDDQGHFLDIRNNPDREARNFLVRFDSLLNPLDTVFVPEHPDGPQVFEHRDESSATRISIPFSGRGQWILSPAGGFWLVVTDQYRLLRVLWPADTVLSSTKTFEPIPVRDEEVDEALQNFGWFEGEIDPSRIPDTKPAVQRAFLDDEGNLWVMPLLEGEDQDRIADVFDPHGIFLGSVRFPVSLNTAQVVVRSKRIVAVTRDSLFVPSVVGLSIFKPGKS